MNWREIIRDEHGRTKIGRVPVYIANIPVVIAGLTVGRAKFLAALRTMLEQADPVPEEVTEQAKQAFDNR